MTAKHTEGTWTADGDTVKCDGRIIGFVAIPRKVDETQNDGECWLDMRKRTQPERDAINAEMLCNAKLFAAAPGLLAALEAVVRVADRKTAEFDMARAAIAAARGTDAALSTPVEG